MNKGQNIDRKQENEEKKKNSDQIREILEYSKVLNARMREEKEEERKASE